MPARRFPGQALEQPEILGTQLINQLRTLIITAKIPARTHLVESELSEVFHVSRGPVRDALTRLQTEGLVERRARGCYVRGLTIRDIDELYSLREAFESLAIRQALLTSPTPNWTYTVEAMASMRAAAEENDHRAFAEADLRFHSGFYEAASHQRLAAIWEQYKPTVEVLLSITNSEDAPLHDISASHERLLALLRGGDGDAAVANLHSHLMDSRMGLISAFNQWMAQEPPQGSTINSQTQSRDPRSTIETLTETARS